MSSLHDQLQALITPDEPEEMSEDYPQLRALLSRLSGIDAESILPEATLKEGLGLSSLDLIEIAIRIEDQWGLKASFERYAKVETVADLRALVDGREGDEESELGGE
ncbi:acyl carrier protein [Corynebacterium sp. ES2794-CONJ1]|uniref:acyl carrier protein n=1 Tax=unclassified Corynebacterium TaxID=2624378 RepID=UPI00216ADDB8|nr:MULTISPECIES: acyl carrier protein [unclassified Corynebacterium]MCS4532425.1 acyl carrier protein [Corynebacterium sp. ES2730-CONJ]MCU9519820.1 acyl carrier protein [Corynebacterium sp. ES2794-CONJ1]